MGVFAFNACPLYYLCIMPYVYQFPDPLSADADGLLAAGGDLSVESLITAYSRGIFPWYNEEPILWWSPDPRMVLFPSDFKVMPSLKQRINSGCYTVKTDMAFREVILHCAAMKRKDQQGTWITEEMRIAYTRLHEAGFAHSFETYHQHELVGGLYGVSLGRVFFGESMFHLKTDASKVALYFLVEWCKQHGFSFIDVQQSTSHLKSLGAVDVPRRAFLKMLHGALKHPTLKGPWKISNE
jgi:leucyl/phenylalanyl-tRNA--protein transferase